MSIVVTNRTVFLQKVHEWLLISPCWQLSSEEYVTSIQDDSPVVPVQFPWRPEEGFQALADLQEHLHAVHGPGLPDCPHLEILRLPKLSVSPGLPLSGKRDGFHCLSHLECGFSTHIPADHSRRTHVETNRYIRSSDYGFMVNCGFILWLVLYDNFVSFGNILNKFGIDFKSFNRIWPTAVAVKADHVSSGISFSRPHRRAKFCKPWPNSVSLRY